MGGETVFYEVVSKVEYKQESIQMEKPKENIGLDIFQTVLDVAGLVPGFGEIADGVNGVIYAARGDNTNAALSFGAMIPFAGWASTGGKFVKKGSDLFEARNVVNTEKMASIYTPIYQDVVNSPIGKTQNQLDILYKTHFQLDTSNDFIFNMPPVKTEIPTTIKSGDVDVKTDIKNVDVGAKSKDIVKPTSNRLEYMGRTPSKSSRTGREVIERMSQEGKIQNVRGKTQFLDGENKWRPLNEADMAYKTDAVTWWNEIGSNYGPKSKEVREWILDSNNYYLEHYSINRSQGASLGEKYLPPDN